MSENNLPKGYKPVESDPILRNLHKNMGASAIQPNFDYKKMEQDFRKQIDSLSTYEDRVKYANKEANKGSVLKAIITSVVAGLILFLVEYHKAVWDFILSLIP